MTQSDAADAPLYPPDRVAGRTLDLTLKRDPHQLVIEPDTFLVPQILSSFKLRAIAGILGDLGGLASLMTGTADPKTIATTLGSLDEVFRILIGGAQGERFIARLNSQEREADPENGRPLPDPPPIDLMRQAIPALMFLLEAYGLRPTQPSSTSPESLTEDQSIPNDGTSSTDGAQPTVSTPGPLTPDAS